MICYPCKRGERHPWHDNGDINWANVFDWVDGRLAPPSMEEPDGF